MLQALIAAVNETPEEDIRDALKVQTEHQLALVPRAPKVIRDTIAYNTTINTDDTVCKGLYTYYKRQKLPECLTTTMFNF